MASIWDNVEDEGKKTEETPAETKSEETPKAEEEKKEEKTETPAAEEQKTEEKTEEKPTVTLRERIIERGRSQYPDEFGEGDFDDERYETMVNKMLGDSDKTKADYDKLHDNNKKLFTIFSEHPDTMQVFENLKGGMSLKKALFEVYGREYLDSEPDSEEEKAYMKKRDEDAERNKTIAENLKTSESERKKFYEESGMSEEEIAAFEKAEDAFWDSYGNGKFDKSYYDMIRKSQTHDTDVANAEEAGRVKGRNEKIVEEKFGDKGDGIPTNEGGAGKGSKEEKKGEEYENEGAELFGKIAGRSKSIWG